MEAVFAGLEHSLELHFDLHIFLPAFTVYIEHVVQFTILSYNPHVGNGATEHAIINHGKYRLQAQYEYLQVAEINGSL